MSSVSHKKLDNILANSNQNSLRALKVIMNGSKVNTNYSHKRNKSPVFLLKSEYNMNKYPFCLKEQRFKWQLDKYINTGPTIKGEMKSYQQENSKNKWDGMNNLGENKLHKDESKVKLEKKMLYRISAENIYTSRSVVPTQNNTPDKSTMKISKKINDESNFKLISSSSFQDLMLRTSLIHYKPTKYSEKLLQGNNIFTPESPKYKRQKKIVPLNEMKDSKQFAGVRSRQIDEVKYFNETNFLTRRNKMYTTSNSINNSYDKNMEITFDKALERMDYKSKGSKTNLTSRTTSVPQTVRNITYKNFMENTKYKSKASTNAESFNNDRYKK